jgi:hypothetical protein
MHSASQSQHPPPGELICEGARSVFGRPQVTGPESANKHALPQNHPMLGFFTSPWKGQRIIKTGRPIGSCMPASSASAVPSGFARWRAFRTLSANRSWRIPSIGSSRSITSTPLAIACCSSWIDSNRQAPAAHAGPLPHLERWPEV